jgi:hypothetical protein
MSKLYASTDVSVLVWSVITAVSKMVSVEIVVSLDVKTISIYTKTSVKRSASVDSITLSSCCALWIMIPCIPRSWWIKEFYKKSTCSIRHTSAPVCLPSRAAGNLLLGSFTGICGPVIILVKFRQRKRTVYIYIYCIWPQTAHELYTL